jgi:hypothetical protein
MMAAFLSRLESLNGWQRLWMVFAALLALVLAGVTAADWPREPDHGPWDRYQPGRGENPFAQFVPDAYPAKTTPRTDSHQNKGKFDLGTAKPLSPAEEKEFLERLERERQAQAGLKAQRVLTALRTRKVWNALALWLVLAVGAYAFGWGVAWVRRGFRDVG